MSTFDAACTAVHALQTAPRVTHHLRALQQRWPLARLSAHREHSGIGGGWIITDELSDPEALVRALADMVDLSATPSNAAVASYQLRGRQSSHDIRCACERVTQTQQIFRTLVDSVDLGFIVAHLLMVRDRRTAWARRPRTLHSATQTVVDAAMEYLGFAERRTLLPRDGSIDEPPGPVQTEPYAVVCGCLGEVQRFGRAHRPCLNAAAVRLLLGRYVHGGLPSDVVECILGDVTRCPMHHMHQTLAAYPTVRARLAACTAIAVEALANADACAERALVYLGLKEMQLARAAPRVASLERVRRKRARGNEGGGGGGGSSSGPWLNTLVVCSTEVLASLRASSILHERRIRVRAVAGHPDLSTTLHTDVLCVNRLSVDLLAQYRFARIVLWDVAIGPGRLPCAEARWIVRPGLQIAYAPSPMPPVDRACIGFVGDVPTLAQLPSCVLVA